MPRRKKKIKNVEGQEISSTLYGSELNLKFMW